MFLFRPNRQINREFTELSLEGADVDLSFVNAGHLCIIPTIPMIHESFMKNWYKTITHWSYHTSPEAKQLEAIECQKLYDNILLSLNKYF